VLRAYTNYLENNIIKGYIIHVSKKINIENFRGIKHLSLELDELTVLIGENNTGKTSILEALQTCLNRSLTRKTFLVPKLCLGTH